MDKKSRRSHYWSKDPTPARILDDLSRAINTFTTTIVALFDESDKHDLTQKNIDLKRSDILSIKNAFAEVTESAKVLDDFYVWDLLGEDFKPNIKLGDKIRHLPWDRVDLFCLGQAIQELEIHKNDLMGISASTDLWDTWDTSGPKNLNDVVGSKTMRLEQGDKIPRDILMSIIGVQKNNSISVMKIESSSLESGIIAKLRSTDGHHADANPKITDYPPKKMVDAVARIRKIDDESEPSLVRGYQRLEGICLVSDAGFSGALLFPTRGVVLFDACDWGTGSSDIRSDVAEMAIGVVRNRFKNEPKGFYQFAIDMQYQ